MTPEQRERKNAKNRERMRAIRAADPEGEKAKNREYARRAFERDPEGYRAHQAAKQRRRRREKPEVVRAEDRAVYVRNREAKKRVSRAAEIKRKARDPEAFCRGAMERRAKRLERDPVGERARLRAHDRNRHAREIGAPGAGISPEQTERLLTESLGLCSYCGRSSEYLEIDHIVPLVGGGAHDPDNAAVACRTCNRSKGHAPLIVWLARLAAP